MEVDMARKTRMRWIVAGAAGLFMLASCTVAETKAPSGPRFDNAPESPLYVGPQAGRPITGDVNGDGFTDIVVACGACCGDRHEPKGGHIVVLLGDGRGGMRDAEGSPYKVGATARKLALGDVDGNGSLDIAVAEHDTNALSMYINDGTGRFTPGPKVEIQSANVRPHTHDVTFADANGDGRADLLATSADSGSISILLSKGNGTFQHAPGSPLKVGRHPYDSISIGDLNGDGKVDFVTPDLHGHAIVTMLGDGTGNFAHAPGSPIKVNDRPGYTAVGDVNGDGKLDAIATHDDYGILDVLLGDGTGRLTPAPGSPIRISVPIWGVAIEDMDGDRRMDIVAGHAGGKTILVLWNDGKNGFSEERSTRSSAGDGAGHIAVADINRDGHRDIVVGNYDSGDVSILLQRR